MARPTGRGGRAWPSIRWAAALGCLPWLLLAAEWAATSRSREGFLNLVFAAAVLVLLPLVAVLKGERWPFAVLGLVGLPPAFLAVVAAVYTILHLRDGTPPFLRNGADLAEMMASGGANGPARLLFWSALTIGLWVAMCFAALARESSGR